MQGRLPKKAPLHQLFEKSRTKTFIADSTIFVLWFKVFGEGYGEDLFAKGPPQ